MSMIGWVQALSPAQIGALRANPSLAGALALAGQFEQLDAAFAETLNHLPPAQREAAQARRRAFEQTPAAKEFAARRAKARAEIDALGPLAPALDLEKSWHVLHYLFTGHVGPAAAPGDMLLSGEEIGDDFGYGPCRLHDTAETAAFARFLATQDLARLQARVNYQEMARLRVYPAFPAPPGQGSDADRENEIRADVAIYFPRLRDYVAAAAEKHGGLLVWVS
jgi:hypothetical protein